MLIYCEPQQRNCKNTDLITNSLFLIKKYVLNTCMLLTFIRNWFVPSLHLTLNLVAFRKILHIPMSLSVMTLWIKFVTYTCSSIHFINGANDALQWAQAGFATKNISGQIYHKAPKQWVLTYIYFEKQASIHVFPSKTYPV